MACLHAKFTDEDEDAGRILNVVRRFEDTVLKGSRCGPNYGLRHLAFVTFSYFLGASMSTSTYD
jgi:hypothetical protein